MPPLRRHRARPFRWRGGTGSGYYMSELLVSAGDRSAALAHFLEALSSGDRDQLRRMLRGRRGWELPDLEKARAQV